ncbi:DNA polymerase III psi subunit [Candidatus Enterovibrio altilux]|uniref:DNA polymerase III psi subunit n=1 Tax=Candidatus Enterovibrio altilux TaxID=1927128 RepID=A0A291B6R2_9GAMM|nr:DNA polymerase III psi subunit [Candidatus Enterovibrio luxaltus]
MNEHDAWLFGKILASMKLEAHHALRVPLISLCQIDEHELEWCWFAGIKQTHIEVMQTLTSPTLAELQNNEAEKRALWLQIKKYEK